MFEQVKNPGARNTRLGLSGLIVLGGLVVLNVAQAKDGEFDVRGAYADEIDGVFYLDAEIGYLLNDTALEALARGVALTFELDIDVRRERRWRPDKNIAELLQLYELQYHALSERYIVRNLNSGEQSSFVTLSAALDNLGDVHDLPLLDAALLNPRRAYTVRIKAILDIRSFPGPLRVLSVFFGDWRLTSKPYSFRLQP